MRSPKFDAGSLGSVLNGEVIRRCALERLGQRRFRRRFAEAADEDVTARHADAERVGVAARVVTPSAASAASAGAGPGAATAATPASDRRAAAPPGSPSDSGPLVR